jgi:predicted HNH restriction endonuclease
LVELEPEDQGRRVVSGMAYIRNPALRAQALERAKGVCEYCAAPGFRMSDGRVFLETHHIVPLREGGTDSEDNIAAICPNHHREAHHGTRALEIRQTLLRKLKHLVPK